MQTITQKQLKEKYGLDLSKGNYAFEIQGNKYKVYKVKDDTQGCILVGRNTIKGTVTQSRDTMTKLMTKLEPACEKGIVTIEII